MAAAPGNFIDRAISFIAPVAGAKRMAARAALDSLKETTALYDGAARSFRTNGRRISSTSANAETMFSLGRLRDVSRDLRRNNALAANAINVIGGHVVGAGIIPTIDSKNGRLKAKIQPLIKAHLETTAIDVEGRHDIYGLQRLIIDTVVEAGEALVVRAVPPKSLNLAVPLQVKVYEPDYLNSLLSGPTSDGGVIFEGVEFDKDGRRVAYHLFTEHPGGGVTWRLPQTRRIPAADVLHVYRVDRPGQVRGVPWCAPVMMTLWDLHDFEDAELVRQKIAACFAVFLKGATPETNLAQQQGAHHTRSGTLIDRLEPGLIQRLPAGVEPFSATPPISSGFRDYINSKGHKIAAGYGVPYELLTTDNSDVSFISGRLGLIQFNKSVDHWRWHMLIPHACDGIGKWFLEACAIELGNDAPLKLRMRHTPPRREMIEPSKEIPAMRDAIRSGLSSLSEELRTLGHDPEVIIAEIAADNEAIDKAGVGLDSDGRRPVAFKLDNQTPEGEKNGKPGN
jgi:lambda family phage portal protein